MGKSTEAFSRTAEIFDTTIGWRFINKAFQKAFGTETMIETAENIAREFRISREDQDRFAHASQEKTASARAEGLFSAEIVPVVIPKTKGEQLIIDTDEHPRVTSTEKLSQLRPITGESGSVTAGNSSGVNDGAAAMIVASESAVLKYGLNPLVRIAGMQTAGVPPRIMGLGPVPAVNKLLGRLGITLNEIGLIELNEAFAAQALGCIRELGLDDSDPGINPMGGAIALGHPLGMSGARITGSAALQMQRSGVHKGLCTMCIGVGQGIAILLEKV
jgi:acetyl-CoA acyltransferase